MKVDYLVVGQGIAGTVLSFLLQQNNKSIAVVDPYPNENASNVSVGICNPVVFRRLTKSWLSDRLLSEAIQTYSELESYLNTELIGNKPIYKLIGSEDEKQLWQKKTFDPDLMDLISIHETHAAQNHLNPTLGFGKVHESIQVSIKKMLHLFRSKLEDEKRFIEVNFDYKELIIKKDHLEWKDIQAKKIIFCEGHKTVKNPFFSWLPFKLTKGEALIIHAPQLKLNDIVNKGVTIFPMENDYFWVGATYDWDDLTQSTTAKAKEQLTDKLKLLVNVPFKIVAQKAGIRPTVKDRRPLIGRHPKINNLLVFNGLGTKGTLIAPYFAKQLIAFIERDEKLNEEVNIYRFRNLFETNESM